MRKNIYGAGIVMFDLNPQHGLNILMVFGKRSEKYSFPKGHLEKEDLTLQDCAIREFKEETGYDVFIPSNAPYWVSNNGGKPYIFYLLFPNSIIAHPDKIGPRINDNDIIEARWMPFQEFQSLTIENANISVRTIYRDCEFFRNIVSN